MESNARQRVMIVDDDPFSLNILEKAVIKAGYKAVVCKSAKEALEQLNKELPELILSDIAMPEMDGFTFCKLVKSETRTRNIPFLFVSAIEDQDKRIQALKMGVEDFVPKPFLQEEIIIRVQNHMNRHVMRGQLEKTNYQLNVMVKKQMKAIEDAKKMALVALAKVTEGTHKITTENHLENVAYNARILAQSLAFTKKYENKISEQFIELISACSMIHDIGKIAIPESILNKPGQLTEEEREEMRTHPARGAQIFDEIFRDIKEDTFMKMARNVVLYHHERFDGQGYPCGLSGEEIPLEARIVTVVDVYDTLRSERCYKPAYSLEEAKERMATIYEGFFDPELIDVFWKVEKQLKKG